MRRVICFFACAFVLAGVGAGNTRDSRLSTIELAAQRYPGFELAGIITSDGEWVFERMTPMRTKRSGRGWTVLPQGTCDTDEECAKKIDSMCQAAGHGKLKKGTATRTKHVADNDTTCSGDCENNGAVGFVTCKTK